MPPADIRRHHMVAKVKRGTESAVDLERVREHGVGWRTVERDSGGSLPSWWTVDSTVGSEKVTFAGSVEIQQTNESIRALEIKGVPGFASDGYEIAEMLDEPGGNRLAGFDSWGQFAFDLYEYTPFAATAQIAVHPVSDHSLSAAIASFSTGHEGVSPTTGAGGVRLTAMTVSTPIRLQEANGDDVIRVERDSKLGFFNATPAAKPTGVAVSAAGIHAALVTLGLIAA